MEEKMDEVKEGFGKIIRDATKEHLMKIESHIRLRIQPKPKWMSTKLWKFLLSKMLKLEYFKEDINLP